MAETEILYEIKEEPSRVEANGKITQPINDFIAGKLKDFSDGWFVAWLHHKILVVEIKNGQVEWKGQPEPDYSIYLVRLRLFDKNKEWHIWKTENNFFARLREEGMAENNTEKWHFTDRELVLSGTQTDTPKDGFVCLWESKGTELLLPESVGQIPKDDLKKRFVLTTRNYIDFDAIGQAGYVDCRFLNINLKEF